MNSERIGLYQWQYNGVASWQDICNWCSYHCKSWWTNRRDTMYFDDEKEYAWFLLRWS